MPLVAATLQTAIETLASKPGSTKADCATKWAQAIGSYMSVVIPASTTAAGGIALLTTALESAFGSKTCPADMDTALDAYALTVAGGMTGAGFTGAPPSTSVGFGELFETFEDTHAAAAKKIADAIHAWAVTGKATPLTTGPVVVWS